MKWNDLNKNILKHPSMSAPQNASDFMHEHKYAYF